MYSKRGQASLTLLRSMTETLSHRGPDDEGFLAVDLHAKEPRTLSLGGAQTQLKGLPLLEECPFAPQLAIGHRRLAILDLSPLGHQPMSYGETLWIAFNGEIYNYLELRSELESLGCSFRSRSDTEVILAAYRHWGEACTSKFNGDWAFCILDARERRLFISRDRFGVKPLYVFENDEVWAFASEIKAFSPIPSFSRRLNLNAAYEHCVASCRDHSSQTFYEGVSPLGAGENLRFDLNSGCSSVSRYYSPSVASEFGRYSQSKAEAYAADIRDLLFDSVRLRLRSDVPVGTCLSGGLDSSAIVAVTSRLLADGRKDVPRQQAFNASFPDQPFDESGFARRVADAFAAELHVVKPNENVFWADLPRIFHHQDEPFGGTSVFAQWEVMKEASRHVKVVLDGQASDEIFGGYSAYRLAFLANLLVKGRLVTLASELKARRKSLGGFRAFLSELRSLPMHVLPPGLKLLLFHYRYRNEFQFARSVFGSDCGNGHLSEHVRRKFASDFNHTLHDYFSYYSLPYLLRGEDRNSMAHSIEARVPYTDYRLVDYVFSIPAAFKIHDGWSKWLLRLAVQDLLPPEIVWRKDKVGFVAPVWINRLQKWEAWRRNGVRTGSLVTPDQMSGQTLRG